MSQVVFRNISHPSVEELTKVVDYILLKTKLNEQKVGRKCLIKINAMSREVMPGRNTSPWLLEAVVISLKAHFPKTTFILGDSDVAGFPQFDDACRNWGYADIAKRHNLKIVKLSDDEYLSRTTNNPICPQIDFPKTVLNADSIINLPVVKTHVLTGITCCLKNHWGMLPRFRYQFHPHVDKVIAEINSQIRSTILNIVDGTICIEGAGPKTGKTKVCSVVFAGTDRVATDQAVLDFMKMPNKLAPHIKFCEKKGIGSTKYTIIGDPFKPQPFEQPTGGDLVSSLEKKIRAIPILGKQFYRPSIANHLGRIGTKYNELVWFNLHGKKYARAILDTPYSKEFKSLIK
jgi:uncharacterized protein (DUF362 family)